MLPEVSPLPKNRLIWDCLVAHFLRCKSQVISLIIGADSISGERERSTLEWLLLTPTSRRQLVVGKYLAAISPWPAAMVISIPFIKLLSQGDEVYVTAVLWGGIFGSLLALALTGSGMLVSFWCNSNKTSYFVSLGIYLLILVPTQLPGKAQTGATGKLLKIISPMEATYHFLEKTLVNNRTLDELVIFILAPALFAAIILTLLIGYAAPDLRLEPGRESKIRSYWGRLAGSLVITCLLFALGSSPTMAFQGEHPANSELQISIDKVYSIVNAGDAILFDTQVTNMGAGESPPLVLAMNIINLDSEGDVVDPEDWSPERTQYIESLKAGESVDLSWRVNAILKGDYMVYIVVIPEPDSQEGTSQPVASSGIHVTVMPFTRLNPGGVLPYVIGVPVILLAGILILFWYRRRANDSDVTQ